MTLEFSSYKCGVHKTKLSWPINLAVVCDENQIGQTYDRSYTCGLGQKWNWVILIDWTGCSIWLKLDTSDHTRLIYVETEIEISRLSEPSAVCYKNHIGQWHDQSYMCSLCQKPNSIMTMNNQTDWSQNMCSSGICSIWFVQQRTFKSPNLT